MDEQKNTPLFCTNTIIGKPGPPGKDGKNYLGYFTCYKIKLDEQCLLRLIFKAHQDLPIIKSTMYKKKDDHIILKFKNHNIKSYSLNLYAENYTECFENHYLKKIKIKIPPDNAMLKGYLTLFYHKNYYMKETIQ